MNVALYRVDDHINQSAGRWRFFHHTLCAVITSRLTSIPEETADYYLQLTPNAALSGAVYRVYMKSNDITALKDTNGA